MLLFAAGAILGLAVVAVVIASGLLTGTESAGSISTTKQKGLAALSPAVTTGVPTTPPTPSAQPSVSSGSAPGPPPARTPTPIRIAATPSVQKIYVVSAGETLWSVAFQHGISVEDLMAANGLTDRAYVQAGQRLVIPGR